MATEEKPIVLDYSPPPERRSLESTRTVVYLMSLVWAGVLALCMTGVLISDARGFDPITASAVTVLTVLLVVLLLKTIGRAGCVTAFILFAVVAVGVMWLAVG